jgi:hypothetical protein
MSWNELPFAPAALNEGVKGKQLNTLYLDYGITKAPKKDGGFRPNADAVHAWLEKKFPKLVGTAYDDLPEKVQRKFKRQYRQPEPSPEMLTEGFRARLHLHLDETSAILDEKIYNHGDHKWLAHYARVQKDLAEAILKVLKKSAAKEDKADE